MSKNKLEVMIDLETLGTSNDCVVTSLGAVIFDLTTGVLLDEFYKKLEIQSQLDLGRKITQDTLKWWSTQDSKIFAESLSGSESSLEVLKSFSNFLSNIYPVVWGNGASFDISILESLFASYKQPLPWSFRDIMDYRTFKRFVSPNLKYKKPTEQHNALADAKAQAEFIIAGLKGAYVEQK